MLHARSWCQAYVPVYLYVVYQFLKPILRKTTIKNSDNDFWSTDIFLCGILQYLEEKN